MSQLRRLKVYPLPMHRLEIARQRAFLLLAGKHGDPFDLSLGQSVTWPTHTEEVLEYIQSQAAHIGRLYEFWAPKRPGYFVPKDRYDMSVMIKVFGVSDKELRS